MSDPVTAPREDASALVARVRSEIGKLDAAQGDRGEMCVGGWYALTGNGYIEAQVSESDLRALCALVEQGERDRRRLDWLAQKLEHVRWDDVFPDLRPRIDAAILRDAAMQPNDSAARTGQEG